MIETDHHLGRILKWLDDEELAANTMVILPATTARKPPGANASALRPSQYLHLSRGKVRVRRRHRVPFIIRWPAKVKAGSNGTSLCADRSTPLRTWPMNVCWPMPARTVSAFCRVLRGVGENSVAPRVAIVHHGSQGRFALREQNWKLVMEDARRETELYDLAKTSRRDDQRDCAALEVAASRRQADGHRPQWSKFAGPSSEKRHTAVERIIGCTDLELCFHDWLVVLLHPWRNHRFDECARGGSLHKRAHVL